MKKEHGGQRKGLTNSINYLNIINDITEYLTITVFSFVFLDMIVDNIFQIIPAFR